MTRMLRNRCCRENNHLIWPLITKLIVHPSCSMPYFILILYCSRLDRIVHVVQQRHHLSNGCSTSCFTTKLSDVNSNFNILLINESFIFLHYLLDESLVFIYNLFNRIWGWLIFSHVTNGKFVTSS